MFVSELAGECAWQWRMTALITASAIMALAYGAQLISGVKPVIPAKMERWELNDDRVDTTFRSLDRILQVVRTTSTTANRVSLTCLKSTSRMAQYVRGSQTYNDNKKLKLQSQPPTVGRHIQRIHGCLTYKRHSSVRQGYIHL